MWSPPPPPPPPPPSLSSLSFLWFCLSHLHAHHAPLLPFLTTSSPAPLPDRMEVEILNFRASSLRDEARRDCFPSFSHPWIYLLCRSRLRCNIDAMSPCRRRHLNGRAAVVSRFFFFLNQQQQQQQYFCGFFFFVTQLSILLAMKHFLSLLEKEHGQRHLRG